MKIYERIEKDRRRKKRQEADLYWKKDPQWYLWFQDRENERFREVPGFHGFYFVSNYGKVISFTGKEPRELKQNFNGGVMTVVLSLDGKSRTHKVHELVYRCFGGHVSPGGRVEHVNGNPRDNRLKNLKVERTKKSPAPSAGDQGPANGLNPKKKDMVVVGINSREVLQFDLHGHFLKKYPAIKIAAAECGLNTGSISKCANGRGHTSGGYQWFLLKDPRFKDGIRDVPPAPVEGREKKVHQFSLEGKYLRAFASLTEAAKETKIPRSTLYKNIKGKITKAHHFQFRLASDPEFRFGVKDIPPVKPKSSLKSQPRAVVQFDIHGRFIAQYPSLRNASRVLNMTGKRLFDALHKKTRTSGEFQWRYRDDPKFRNGIVPLEPLKKVTARMVRTILQFDLKGSYLRQFKDTGEACEAVGVRRQAILNAINGINKKCAGFQWRSAADPMFKDGIRDIAPVRYDPRPGSRRVRKFSRMGILVETFPTISAAAEDMGVSFGGMTKWIEKGHPDETFEFYWEYETG